MVPRMMRDAFRGPEALIADRLARSKAACGAALQTARAASARAMPKTAAANPRAAQKWAWADMPDIGAACSSAAVTEARRCCSSCGPRIEKAARNPREFNDRYGLAPTLWRVFCEGGIFVGDPLVYDTRLAPGDTGRRPFSFWRRSRSLAPPSPELRIAIGIAHGRPVPRRQRDARLFPFDAFGTTILGRSIGRRRLLRPSEAARAPPWSKLSTLSRRMRQNRPILKPSSSPRLRAFLATRVVTFSLFAASKRLSGGHSC